MVAAEETWSTLCSPLVGHTLYSSDERHPGCILIKCPNHLNWLLLRWSSSDSSPSSLSPFTLRRKLIQPVLIVISFFCHYPELVTMGEVWGQTGLCFAFRCFTTTSRYKAHSTTDAAPICPRDPGILELLHLRKKLTPYLRKANIFLRAGGADSHPSNFTFSCSTVWWSQQNHIISND